MARKAFGGVEIKCDAALKAITGKDSVTPAELTKKTWDYVKRKGLLKRGTRKKFGGLEIVPDAALAAVIGGGKKMPSAMTKNMWEYIKEKGLLKRG